MRNWDRKKTREGRVLTNPMEKKKLLLVAVSVGVVLLIIIGIPLLLISPRQVTAPTVHPVRDITHVDPFARPVQPVQPQAQVIQPTQPYIQPTQPLQYAQREGFGQRPEAILEPAREVAVPAAPPVTRDETPRVVTTITIPAPRTAAVPDAPAAPARPAPARPAPAPAAQARPAPQPARPAATVTRPAAPAPAAVPTPTRNNFWVQTGAFSSKARAETVKESLEAKGIASIIENRNIDGRTLYRVRVGPYLSETEANYWLALVRSIDGFADSQVRVSQAPIN